MYIDNHGEIYTSNLIALQISRKELKNILKNKKFKNKTVEGRI